MIWKIFSIAYLLVGIVGLINLCIFIEAATKFLRHWSKPLNVNINNKPIEVSSPTKETKEMIQ